MPAVRADNPENDKVFAVGRFEILWMLHCEIDNVHTGAEQILALGKHYGLGTSFVEEKFVCR